MTRAGQGSVSAAGESRDGTDHGGPAGPAPLGAAGFAALNALRHRVELAALEAAEARDHAAMTAVLLASAVGLGLMAGFALTLLLAVLVWNQPWRGEALGALALLEGMAGVLCGAAVRARLRRWRPFDGISEQLRQDAQCLQKLTEPFTR